MTAPQQDTSTQDTLVDHLIRTHGTAAARVAEDAARHALHDSNLSAAETWIGVFRALAHRTHALHATAVPPQTRP